MNNFPYQERIPLEERGIIETPTLTRYAIATLAVVALATTRQESLITTIDLRDSLPEPWDVSDHIANAMWTVGLVGTTLHYASHRMAARNDTTTRASGYAFEVNTREKYAERKQKLAITAATLAIGLNLFAENRAFLDGATTGDSTDFVYGLVGGLLAYATTKPRFLDPDTSNELITSLPNEHRLKQHYLGARHKALQDQVVDKSPRKPNKSSNKHHNPRARRKR
jgi:hypothetical protein